MNKQMKEILGRFKDLQFFTGESMDCDGMVAMCEYRDVDGTQQPVFMFIKQGQSRLLQPIPIANARIRMIDDLLKWFFLLLKFSGLEEEKF